jgi:outer membrane protein TolC
MSRMLQVFLFTLLACSIAQAQTTPIQTPDPTAPPNAARPSPQSPPGTDRSTQAPQTPSSLKDDNGKTPSAPSQRDEAQTKLDQNPLAGRPLLESLQPRSVPPLPSLERFGISDQQTLPLTLNEAVRRALLNNNDILVARDDVRIAQSVLRAAEGVYDPVFQFTPQYSNFVTPESSALGGAGQSGTVSQTLIDFGPSLTKSFQKGGGQYQFFFNNTRTTTNSTFAQLSPTYAGNLGVTFVQPLWRNRSIDLNRREIRIRRKKLEQSDADFRQRAIEIISQVQRAYWELVFALRDQQDLVNNLNLIREQYLQTEQRIEAGATAPIERAEVQTELSNRESEILLATQNVSVAENALKRLITADTRASEWSLALIPTDLPAFDAAATPINSEEVLEEARRNRPELRRLRLQQDISNIDISYFRNQTRPRLDLLATVSTTGLAGTPLTDSSVSSGVPENLVGGYGRMVRNLLKLNTRNVVVGMTIQLPLRNKVAKANLATAEIQSEQLLATMRNQETAIEVEVRNAAQAAETARRRVLAARTARQNAAVQLEAEKRLFRLGRSTTFLLFQRENQLANARNLELRVETDYNKALADLQRATSTTLGANHVVVEALPGVP